MKQSGILFFCALLFCSSCATICNSELQRVNVVAQSGYHVAQVGNASIRSGEDSSSWYVYRQKAPLEVIVTKDSLRDTLLVKSHLNAAFVFGNFFGSYGLGYIVDLQNNRRFSYPRSISIQPDFANNLYAQPVHGHLDPHPAGKVVLNIGWGMYNHLEVPYPAGQVGMDGVSTEVTGGLCYYITDRYGFGGSFGIAGAANYPQGFERYYGDGGEYEQATGTFGTLHFFQNSKQQRLQWRAGLCYMQTAWERAVYYSYRDGFYFTSQHTLLGAELGGELRFTNNLSLDVNYRPMLLDFGTNTLQFNYAHSITAGFAFNFGLFRFQDGKLKPAFGKSPK